MKLMRKQFDRVEHHFMKGGRLEAFYPLYEMLDTMAFTPGHVTRSGSHVRDGLDLKRMMFTVVVALQPVVTADVFRRLQQRSNPGLPPVPQPLTRPAQLGLWLAETRNDLHPAAVSLLPVIAELEARLAATDGCMLARMSGSGGTVFGLFGSGAQAHQAAHDLRRHWPDYWVAAAPVIQPPVHLHRRTPGADPDPA